MLTQHIYRDGYNGKGSYPVSPNFKGYGIHVNDVIDDRNGERVFPNKPDMKALNGNVIGGRASAPLHHASTLVKMTFTAVIRPVGVGLPTRRNQPRQASIKVICKDILKRKF